MRRELDQLYPPVVVFDPASRPAALIGPNRRNKVMMGGFVGLAMVVLLSFLMVSTVRYRTFKDAHVSPKSLAVMGFLALTGLAVGWATRASFVLVVYMAAYIAMGLAESLFFHAKRITDLTRLPPAVRAELEADEALEPSEEDDDEKDKEERDEYI